MKEPSQRPTPMHGPESAHIIPFPGTQKGTRVRRLPGINRQTGRSSQSPSSGADYRKWRDELL